MQKKLQHHGQVSRQVDNGGVHKERDEEKEDSIEGITLLGLQHGNCGDHRVVEVTVAHVVTESLPQGHRHDDQWILALLLEN